MHTFLKKTIFKFCTYHKISLSLSLTLSLSLSLSLFIYIYIYIYHIMRELVVTKSLCGLVADQVQYNMESAQYLG